MENKGSVFCDKILDPKIRLSVQGISYSVKPGNFLTRLFWRFIRVEIEMKDMSMITNLLVRKQNPGEYQWKK